MRIHNAIAIACSAAALAFASPALAVRTTSFCGVDQLPSAKLIAAAEVFSAEDSDAFRPFYTTILADCTKRVSAKVADDDRFEEFVFYDALTFAFRERLAQHDFNMDAMDRKLDMQCNNALIPKDEDVSDEALSVISKAAAAAGHPIADMSDSEINDVAAYSVGLGSYWRLGQQIGLLDDC